MNDCESASLIGDSAAMRALGEQLRCAARSDAKVLITGESGVGKEIAARQIHRLSSRARSPIFALNCAGMPEPLLESELFGHTRGSFTGAVRDTRGVLEEADAGTVFLDEVGEMSLRMQTVLLRFLETGELQRVGSAASRSRVNVRIISATNRNLLKAVHEREFRNDLYYRLNVIHVAIPPLRERRADIPLLLAHYLQTFAARYRVAVPALSDEVAARFEKYHWPGNVRELKNVLERIVVMQQGRDVQIDHLPPDMQQAESGGGPSPAALAIESTVDALFAAMANGCESFWTVVHEPFMSRDLTRADVRALVRRGLGITGGSYKLLVALFNIEAGDYRRFLNFLSKHDCHVEFRAFRTLSRGHAASPEQADEARVSA